MSLLERVSTLLRANLNNLIEKAEDPEKLLKQLVLDMENQLMQVKTQVAIAIADEHLLAKKRKEHEDAEVEWKRKAELAVRKGDDGLARAALERSLSAKGMTAGFAQQMEDQKTEVETLKTALRNLDQKLAETRNCCELMIAESRRARTSAAGKGDDRAEGGRFQYAADEVEDRRRGGQERSFTRADGWGFPRRSLRQAGARRADRRAAQRSEGADGEDCVARRSQNERVTKEEEAEREAR
jgi:phage shock protein A